MSELVIWSAARGEWLSPPPDEIVWLDRVLLSDGRDRSLHRPPRCPGLRYVHHRWELFSRDPTHQVYVAALPPGDTPDYRAVEQAAAHVLPIARAALESQPTRLDAGSWAVSVGTWVLPLRIEMSPSGGHSPTVPIDAEFAVTQDRQLSAGATTEIDAVGRVALYFEHNPTARLAMAYYYQDFIEGGLAPHARPIADVAIELDLVSEAAVSEYKKELQRRIWKQQGHQRELGEFLLQRGLITQADLRKARELAAMNEASGRTEEARKRLRYGHRRRSREG